MKAILNITYNGLSVDVPGQLDFRTSDFDLKRIAVEVIRSGDLAGLQIANLDEGAFQYFVVDRFDTPEGGKRIYLRPKVPFGAGEQPSVRVVLCGVGALGSAAAVLCRNLDVTLVLVDFDRVESKNLLAQAYVKQSVGKNKAQALKLQLQNFWGLKAEAKGVRLRADNLDAVCGGADLLVDCFDNAASRTLLSGWARAHNVPLVHAAIAADGAFGVVRWDERFVPDEEDEAGQATCEGGEHLPFIGLVGAALARVIQDFARGGARRDLMVTLSAVTPTA